MAINELEDITRYVPVKTLLTEPKPTAEVGLDGFPFVANQLALDFPNEKYSFHSTPSERGVLCNSPFYPASASIGLT